jgi:hypothetical protein
MKTMVSSRALLLLVVFGSIHAVMGQMPLPRQQVIAKFKEVAELAPNLSVQSPSGGGNFRGGQNLAAGINHSLLAGFWIGVTQDAHLSVTRPGGFGSSQMTSFPEQISTGVLTGEGAGGNLHLVKNNGPYSRDANGGAPDFTIAANPLALQLVVGGTATSQISLSSSNGFSDSIQLACENLPKNVFCTFAPSTVDLPQGETASSQLTLSTVQGKVIRSAERVMSLAIIPILGGMFFWRSVRVVSGATVLVILASLMLFSGCQGLAPTSSTGQAFTVSATALSGTTHSVQLQVTLQQ